MSIVPAPSQSASHTATERPRILPRRPRASGRVRPAVEEPAENLFGDVFGADVIALAPPAERARARTRRVMEAALDRAVARALPDLANLWAAEADTAANRPAPHPDHDTQALREVLCAAPDIAPDEPATPAARNRLRLAVHAMNTTMTIAFPAVGAIVMTYTFLKGENMRLTARTMVAMAAVMSLMHMQVPGV